MYREEVSPLPQVVAWSSVTPPGGATTRVLPDGCLDLIWADGEVFVAGPDTSAKLSTAAGGTRYAALRFAAGTGPAVLAVPADALTDRFVPLVDLWPAVAVRPLAEAGDPASALLRVARDRWRPPDPVLVAVAAGARAGAPAATLAAGCGWSTRHLHRRCQAAFGYGPKTLTRILRLHRALDLARAGRPLAEVADTAGYADQAHLARNVRDLTGLPLTTLLLRARGSVG